MQILQLVLRAAVVNLLQSLLRGLVTEAENVVHDHNIAVEHDSLQQNISLGCRGADYYLALAKLVTKQHQWETILDRPAQN